MENKENKENKEKNELIINTPKEWHPQHHNILKEWAEIGYSYRYLHDKAFIYYSKQNLRFALPVIIISTLTGTANFAQQSFPKDWQTTTPLIIGTFNLVAGLITTIAQFLRVSELLEGNRSASIGYDKFSKRFEKKAFFKPNILDINPIQIYIDGDEEERKAIKLIEKQKNFQNKILKQEKDMRNQILEHIKTEQKEHDIKIKEEFEKRKLKKKQKLSTRSVTKNIDKLLKNLNNVGNIDSVITPDTSDLDSNDENSFFLKENHIINNNIIDSEIIKKPKEMLNNISILIKEENENITKNNNEQKEILIDEKKNIIKSKIPKPNQIIKFEKS